MPTHSQFDQARLHSVAAATSRVFPSDSRKQAGPPSPDCLLPPVSPAKAANGAPPPSSRLEPAHATLDVTTARRQMKREAARHRDAPGSPPTSLVRFPA